MTEPVYIAGISCTRLAKRPDTSVKALVREAVEAALKDAGADVGDIDAAWFSNTRQPMLEGQNTVRGQIALRPLGFESVPVVNIENACASGSSALIQAMAHLKAGMADIALVVGAEKMVFPDRPEAMAAAFEGGTDIHDMPATKAFVRSLGGDADDRSAGSRSIFMDLYAAQARAHMDRFGTRQEDFAAIAAKNHTHARHNPRAQYREPMTVAEVMADKPIAFPFTRSMCAPLSDGAAAAVVCNAAGLKRLESAKARAVTIRASALRSGVDRETDDFEQHIGRLTAIAAYREAGVEPQDIDCVEVHDATAYAELQQIENLGLAEPGTVGARLARGDFALGGRQPVNASGGLLSKGHPVGATGIIQLHDLALQLRGEAGSGQIEGARMGLAENGGGFLRGEEAATVVTILERGPWASAA
ncbi:thiolase family protein [Pelagerythrobacter marinus]|uniref:thiolase family protein n=1 Tax=Pelagerythrobacter marinus TaxID=538382 RepID=UPI002037454E|nr:thiolase family protein [Pelagerythrobacter marinus]USA39442.1 thiolase family protein [Pelagerythrobacter marinus]WPZ06418.1 thiolase family protein [Pelagerythrobacter marinus]